MIVAQEWLLVAWIQHCPMLLLPQFCRSESSPYINYSSFMVTHLFKLSYLARPCISWEKLNNYRKLQNVFSWRNYTLIPCHERLQEFRGVRTDLQPKLSIFLPYTFLLLVLNSWMLLRKHVGIFCSLCQCVQDSILCPFSALWVCAFSRISDYYKILCQKPEIFL